MKPGDLKREYLLHEWEGRSAEGRKNWISLENVSLWQQGSVYSCSCLTASLQVNTERT